MGFLLLALLNPLLNRYVLPNFCVVRLRSWCRRRRRRLRHRHRKLLGQMLSPLKFMDR